MNCESFTLSNFKAQKLYKFKTVNPR